MFESPFEKRRRRKLQKQAILSKTSWMADQISKFRTVYRNEYGNYCTYKYAGSQIESAMKSIEEKEG